jgi:CBS domain-containing protein
MTENVVTVPEDMPYKEIVATLAQHAVSAVPVVDEVGRVVGVVSEADLLHKMEFAGLEPHLHLIERRQRRVARVKALGDTARDLMSSPAVTVSPEAALTAAASTMESERVKRLPVVDGRGRAVGIVSRRDLLRVYLRDDEAIRDEIRNQVLRQTLWIDPDTIDVTVDQGVVVLMGRADRRSTAQIIVRLCEAVPGVVEVIDQLEHGYDDTADMSRHHFMSPMVKETIP